MTSARSIYAVEMTSGCEEAGRSKQRELCLVVCEIIGLVVAFEVASAGTLDKAIMLGEMPRAATVAPVEGRYELANEAHHETRFGGS